MTSDAGYAEVIGDPIAQSKSPAIHNFWLRKLGIESDYRATRVTRAELADFIAGRRQERAWRGCNVTMPLKLDAIMLADETSDRAVAAGATNLLVRKEDKLLAGNTDVGGVMQLLGPRIQEGVPGGITLLGNGGAARAVLVAVKLLDYPGVRIQARDVSAAYKLAIEFGLEIEPVPFDHPVDTEGLVNATPLGMKGVEPFTIDIARMPANGFVFDMVTEPLDTPLLRSARERGLAVTDGITMLVEQAAASFMLLFGSQAPRQFDGELLKALRP
jgi:shikimate dehydrogenase